MHLFRPKETWAGRVPSPAGRDKIKDGNRLVGQAEALDDFVSTGVILRSLSMMIAFSALLPWQPFATV